MSIEKLKNQMPDFAKDIKLNLSMVLSTEGAPDLTQKQLLGVALASAYATKNAVVIAALMAEINDQLADDEIQAAKSAAAIMAMNNIYYRFTHLVGDKAYATMPAKLRMNVIGNPGVNKVDFELNCLAVSAINGCGMCLDAHAHELTKAGLSKLAVQSAVRIASVVSAAAFSLEIAA
jgi:alkyl hydroperoxide reductase subunit D